MMERRAFFDVITDTSRKNNKMVNSLDYGNIKLRVYKKRITVKLKRSIISALMYLAMEMNWFTQFMFQIKKLKIIWIYY